MREKIKLESSAGTGHFYTTTKNKRTTTEKLSMTKFDPKARKHVLYKETKLKQAETHPSCTAFQFDYQFILDKYLNPLSGNIITILPDTVASWRNLSATANIPPELPPIIKPLFLAQILI